MKLCVLVLCLRAGLPMAVKQLTLSLGANNEQNIQVLEVFQKAQEKLFCNKSKFYLSQESMDQINKLLSSRIEQVKNFKVTLNYNFIAYFTEVGGVFMNVSHLLSLML